MVSIASSVLLLAACAAAPARLQHTETPLLFDASEVARADTLAFFIPGALSPVSIFDGAKAWRDRYGYALVYYRLPGLDGLALDHTLEIQAAANTIAGFAERYPEKRIRIVGYSTGGPIGILAAGQLDGDVRVAAISTAVERAGGISTRLRAAADIAAAGIRAGSLDREKVWLEYYRTLLFGRAGLSDADLRPVMSRLVETEKERIVLPRPALSKAHTSDLSNWSVPEDFRIDPDRVRFFVGKEDPVFSTAQVSRFSDRLGGIEIKTYPKDGHILFLTRPSVFDDIAGFFEAG